MIRKTLNSLKRLRILVPSPRLVARIIPVLGIVVVGVGAYVMGRSAVSPASAQSQAARATSKAGAAGDYEQRVVAYIHNTIPVTREELGEFLISRFGAERLETLVNRKIVEMACRTRGIEVTDAEVEFQFKNDLRALSPTMTPKDFESQILRRFNKTIYEWKEDVIRPKLMMTKYVYPSIEVTDEDLRKGFEGRYGPKVECRMIVLQNDKHKEQIWHECRKGEPEFVKMATTNNLPQLAASGGKIPPIHKHFGDERLERIAFGLKPGEVGPLVEMPDKTVIILKCDKHIEQDRTKTFERERLALSKEMFDMKLNQKIPEVVADLRKAANIKLMLRNETRQEDLERAVSPELRGGPANNTVPTNAIENKQGN